MWTLKTKLQQWLTCSDTGVGKIHRLLTWWLRISSLHLLAKTSLLIIDMAASHFRHDKLVAGHISCWWLWASVNYLRIGQYYTLYAMQPISLCSQIVQEVKKKKNYSVTPSYNCKWTLSVGEATQTVFTRAHYFTKNFMSHILPSLIKPLSHWTNTH